MNELNRRVFAWGRRALRHSLLSERPAHAPPGLCARHRSFNGV